MRIFNAMIRKNHQRRTRDLQINFFYKSLFRRTQFHTLQRPCCVVVRFAGAEKKEHARREDILSVHVMRTTANGLVLLLSIVAIAVSSQPTDSEQGALVLHCSISRSRQNCLSKQDPCWSVHALLLLEVDNATCVVIEHYPHQFAHRALQYKEMLTSQRRVLVRQVASEQCELVQPHPSRVERLVVWVIVVTSFGVLCFLACVAYKWRRECIDRYEFDKQREQQIKDLQQAFDLT